MVSAVSCHPISIQEERKTQIAEVMGKIIEVKEKKRDLVESKRISDPGEWVMVGGDFFSVVYLGFQTATVLKPSLQGIQAVGAISLGCGVIGGVINIGVGLVCLKEALQAIKNKDYVLAARLLTFFVGLIGIGAIMVLTSLAIRVSALASVNAVFASSPWILPTLFFISSLPLIFELSLKVYRQAISQDMGSLIKEKKSGFSLQEIINSEANPYSEEVIKQLSEKLEELQAEIGVNAGVEAFRLFKEDLEGKGEQQKEATREKFEEQVKKWNRLQKIRLFQQVLCIASFGLSMGSLSIASLRTIPSQTLQNSLMMGVNAIPTAVDTLYPWERNVPYVAPIVESKELKL